MISIMSHPAIEDNMSESKPLVFELAFGISERPPVDDKDSGLTRDVVIDLHGTRENFCIGQYNLKSHKWECYSKETIHDEMKWMDILPLASKDNK